MSVSLEDQRRALLEQIEASRAAYRRMLAGESAADVMPISVAGRSVPQNSSVSFGGSGVTRARIHAARTASGGRSQAVQWAMEHPLWVAGGVALLVLLLPRIADARRHRSREQRRRDSDRDQAMQQVRGSGAARALLTAGLLLMRDPGRLQAAGRLLGTGWRWLQRWRGRPVREGGASPATSRWLH